jgi:hypothetical protein
MIYIDGHKSDCFALYRSVQYVLTNGKTIIMPKGMETDFASIPRLFWVLYPPHLKQYREPAIVHDYLYIEQKTIVSRAFADMEFRRLLLREGVSIFTAYLFWAIIRIFGAKRWNKYKNNGRTNN